MLPVAILCGGLATRLRPRTETIPKSLLPVAGEPFLAHQLRLLARSGVTDVVLCAGYLGEQLQSFAGNGSRFGLSVQYSFDGPLLLGTAGALRNATRLLGDAFLVLYGDSYLRCDYAAVANAFERSGKEGLMTVYRNDGLFDTSNVDFDGETILVYNKRHSTPAMRYIDYGLGALRSHALGGEADLATVYERLVAAGQLAGYEVSERFYEIGSLAGLADAEQLLSAS